jgi:RimJ/RimL family protein N-acetyltransferase
MIETARLRLLPMLSEDWLALRPIATDPEVVRYISNGVPWSDERIQEFVGRQVKHFKDYGYCFWKLLHKENGEMIGFCGLQPLPGTDEIEIGWWLARAWWGQGLATEAAREALRHGFERAGLDRIVAIAILENRASTHIMEKLGMKYERDTMHRGDKVVLYAIANPTANVNRDHSEARAGSPD